MAGKCRLQARQMGLLQYNSTFHLHSVSVLLIQNSVTATLWKISIFTGSGKGTLDTTCTSKGGKLTAGIYTTILVPVLKILGLIQSPPFYPFRQTVTQERGSGQESLDLTVPSIAENCQRHFALVPAVILPHKLNFLPITCHLLLYKKTKQKKDSFLQVA